MGMKKTVRGGMKINKIIHNDSGLHCKKIRTAIYSSRRLWNDSVGARCLKHGLA